MIEATVCVGSTQKIEKDQADDVTLGNGSNAFTLLQRLSFGPSLARVALPPLVGLLLIPSVYPSV